MNFVLMALAGFVVVGAVQKDAVARNVMVGGVICLMAVLMWIGAR